MEKLNFKKQSITSPDFNELNKMMEEFKKTFKEFNSSTTEGKEIVAQIKQFEHL